MVCFLFLNYHYLTSRKQEKPPAQGKGAGGSTHSEKTKRIRRKQIMSPFGNVDRCAAGSHPLAISYHGQLKYKLNYQHFNRFFVVFYKFDCGNKLRRSGRTQNKKEKLLSFRQELFRGAPEEIRTPDLLIRSQTLYPTELRARTHCIPECLYIIAHSFRNVNPFFEIFSDFFRFFLRRKLLFSPLHFTGNYYMIK